MAAIKAAEVATRLSALDQAASAAHKGTMLEELVERIIASIPGVNFSERRARNYFNSEEIDLCFWNDGEDNGLFDLPQTLLVECKNWSKPIGSMEVCWFLTKLKRRSLGFGILVAMNGVTGDADDLSEAHEIGAYFLQQGVRLVVLTRTDLEQFTTGRALVKLIQQKLLKLTVGFRLQD
jgi:Restriction endonuclease